jgi:hypothetical protein
MKKQTSGASNEITVSTDPGHRCQHCDRVFRREQSLMSHVCEQGRRHLERNEVGVQIGLQAYLRFYEIMQGSSRLRSWDDFRQSPYYRAFVRFGRHCQGIRAVAIPRFIDWLVQGNRKIDHWCSDNLYAEFLQGYVRRENVADALARTIEQALAWQEETQHPAQLYLRHANANAVCYAVTTGRVTAWSLYNSDSGQEFLTRVNAEQLQMIWPWIDSDFWDQKFRDYPADVEYARDMLSRMGW